MNKLFYICIAISLFGSNCKKKNPTPLPAGFMPTTAGSSWDYTTQSYSPIPSTGNYTLTAIAKDTIVNARTYRVFTHTGSSNEYYNVAGTDYRQYSNFTAAINQQLELLYLKDAVTGTMWAEIQPANIPGIPTAINIPLNYEIKETGINYTVGTKTFSGVTHVKMTLGTIVVMGIPVTPVSDFNIYYARGIGRIYSRAKLIITAPLLGVNINTNDEVKLINYTIL